MATGEASRVETTQVKSLQGTTVGTAEVDGSLFGEQGHPVLLREAVIMYRANQRLGTVKVKRRSEIRGSTKKQYRQKHTGRARHGDKKAPQYRGGGVAHGPEPRDHSFALPRKALRKALGTMLARKLADGEVVRWMGATFDKPSTKSAMRALESLGAAGSALVVGSGPVDRNLLLSLRNLPKVKALPAGEVTALDVVRHHRVVLLDGALEVLAERVARVGKGGHFHASPRAAAARAERSDR
jgi:large subunit ribosomal protein L4